MKSKIQYEEEIDNVSDQGPSVYAYLETKDVITSQVSDHYPIIHDGILFWNVMMQGRKRGNGFNNGFGLVEDDGNYKTRLIKVAHVIAEAVYRDPSIEAICLCEGPIKEELVKILYDSLKTFPWMQRFISENRFHKPQEAGPEWGLLMLADTRYKVTKVNLDGLSHLPNLVNRFQLWQLQHADITKYVALAHFPFSGDVYITEKTALSARTQIYCQFIQYVLDQYEDKRLIFCADFNFNPYLIGQPTERVLDQIANHNSILLNFEEKSGLFNTDAVTVDGILLSQKEKQNYLNSVSQQGLIRNLKYDYQFFRLAVKDAIGQKDSNEHLTFIPTLASQAG
ncbi:hypothetical protein ACQUW5_03915 [Legionella sp. CNM-1927-20]|uniref:hypothetical protein n=1 Tax=Legionella sp. CNM-1927-20 TaxID=3422221 RepID=UPI00403AC085